MENITWNSRWAKWNNIAKWANSNTRKKKSKTVKNYKGIHKLNIPK